jgi:energy-coupling factor transport system substrate-specific component
MVAIGIGSAVFVILGRFGAIPTGVPNTNFETVYAFLALMAIIFGPIAGVLIGFIGHTLKDLLLYGSPWFSWIIASAVVGLIIGLAARQIRLQSGEFGKRELIRFNIYQIVANGLAWFLIAPVLDILIYAEPVNKVFVQSLVAGSLNIVTVAVIGSLLAAAYAKTRTKKGSLTKEG